MLALCLSAMGLATAAEVWWAGGMPLSFCLLPLVTGLAILPLAHVTIRRLHHLGHSGVWAVLALLPVLGLGLALYLLLFPGDRQRAPVQAAPATQSAGRFLVVGLVLLVLARAVFKPYWVPSGSMMPGLLPGDYLIVTAPPLYQPERGDVIAFQLRTRHLNYIKRVVGLPGDRLQMRGGVLYLNGAAVPQQASGTFVQIYRPQGPAGALPTCANAPVGMGGTCQNPILTETLPNGPAYATLNAMDNGPLDDTPVFSVPAGHYFVMGDNRDTSLDSRFSPEVDGVGMLPADAIIGRADRVLFSAAGTSLWALWTWRSDRFFRAIQ